MIRSIWGRHIIALLSVELMLVSFAIRADVQPAREEQRVFMCKPANGRDSAGCLQRAIDFAANGNGRLYLPAGIWLLSRALVLKSNVFLVGEGAASVLKALPDNISDPVLMNISSGAENVGIKNIVFDGGGPEFPNGKPVISGTTVHHVIFDQVTVRNTHGIALLLQGGTTDSGVKDSEFLNIGNHWKKTLQSMDRLEGLTFCCGSGNARNFSSGNHFRDVGADALQISEQEEFNARYNVFDLSNEQFKMTKLPDYPSGIFAMNSKHVAIQNNVIRDAPGNGIDAPALVDSSIEHNTVTGSGGTGIGIFIGYDRKAQSHDVSIFENTVSNNVRWPHASFLGGITIAGGEPSDIIISRNRVSDTQRVKTQQYGVYVAHDTNVTNLRIDDDNKLSGNLIEPVHNDSGSRRQ